MASRPIGLRAGVAALAAGTMIGAALVPAGAGAASTGWRITHTNDIGEDNSLDEVAATGPKSVWAVGSVHRYQGRDHWYEPLLQRYDGNSWQRIPDPGGTPKGFFTSVDASSPQNVWVAEKGWTDLPGSLLHWNGSEWRTLSLGETTDDPDVATVKSGNAWVTAETGDGNAALKYWDGHALRTISGPGGVFRTVDARTDRDVWAAGYYASQPEVAHWNGHAWKRAKLPHIPLTGEAPDQTAEVLDLKAISAKNIWAVGQMHSLSDDPDGVSKPFALHWNGKKWTHVDRNVTHEHGGFSSVAPDGSGGVWLSGRNEYLTHYAKGRWSTAEVARDQNTVFSLGVAGLSRVPGTKRVQGVGSVDLVNDPDPLKHEAGVFGHG